MLSIVNPVLLILIITTFTSAYRCPEENIPLTFEPNGIVFTCPTAPRFKRHRVNIRVVCSHGTTEMINQQWVLCEDPYGQCVTVSCNTTKALFLESNRLDHRLVVSSGEEIGGVVMTVTSSPRWSSFLQWSSAMNDTLGNNTNGTSSTTNSTVSPTPSLSPASTKPSPTYIGFVCNPANTTIEDSLCPYMSYYVHGDISDPCNTSTFQNPSYTFYTYCAKVLLGTVLNPGIPVQCFPNGTVLTYPKCLYKQSPNSVPPVYPSYAPTGAVPPSSPASPAPTPSFKNSFTPSPPLLMSVTPTPRATTATPKVTTQNVSPTPTSTGPKGTSATNTSPSPSPMSSSSTSSSVTPSTLTTPRPSSTPPANTLPPGTPVPTNKDEIVSSMTIKLTFPVAKTRWESEVSSLLYSKLRETLGIRQDSILVVATEYNADNTTTVTLALANTTQKAVNYFFSTVVPQYPSLSVQSVEYVSGTSSEMVGTADGSDVPLPAIIGSVIAVVVVSVGICFCAVRYARKKREDESRKRIPTNVPAPVVSGEGKCFSCADLATTMCPECEGCPAFCDVCDAVAHKKKALQGHARKKLVVIYSSVSNTPAPTSTDNGEQPGN